MRREKLNDFWAEVYDETVMWKELPDYSDHTWRLQTGDANIARRVRRKKGFKQLVCSISGYLWIFQAKFSSRGNAIRSLSRILREDVYWDETRQLIACERVLQDTLRDQILMAGPNEKAPHVAGESLVLPK